MTSVAQRKMSVSVVTETQGKTFVAQRVMSVAQKCTSIAQKVMSVGQRV